MNNDRHIFTATAFHCNNCSTEKIWGLGFIISTESLCLLDYARMAIVREAQLHYTIWNTVCSTARTPRTITFVTTVT